MSAPPSCPRGPARSAIARAACAAVALLAVLAVAPGCGLVRPATDARARPEATFPARPLDGLLVRPDLQALVDAQVRRDAAPLVAALVSPDAAVRARAAFCPFLNGTFYRHRRPIKCCRSSRV